MKLSSTRKVLILLLLGFFTRFVISCKDHPPIEMYYNSMEAIGVDNSGRFMQVHDVVNTIYNEAVTIQICLFDSTDYHHNSSTLSFN